MNDEVHFDVEYLRGRIKEMDRLGADLRLVVGFANTIGQGATGLTGAQQARLAEFTTQTRSALYRTFGVIGDQHSTVQHAIEQILKDDGVTPGYDISGGFGVAFGPFTLVTYTETNTMTGEAFEVVELHSTTQLALGITATAPGFSLKPLESGTFSESCATVGIAASVAHVIDAGGSFGHCVASDGSSGENFSLGASLPIGSFLAPPPVVPVATPDGVDFGAAVSIPAGPVSLSGSIMPGTFYRHVDPADVPGEEAENERSHVTGTTSRDNQGQATLGQSPSGH